MKELTIQEKAERYNKAYKVAENIHKCSSNHAEIKRMEQIFPELKESEGEKIRKVLFGWINLEPSTSFNDTFDGFSKEQILAWLEKQGNTNIFDVPKISIKNAVEVTSRMQYIDDDIKPIAEFIMDYANWDLHKDKWNQPTLTVPLFRVLDALIQKGKPYCVCSQNIEKQGEQKSFDYENANIPQKDSTWSEEDESNFQMLIDVIKENKHHSTDYEHMTYYKLLTWFKSLKDRYVWKPSNEQMEVLSIYAHVHDVLASLYQDLKKLKG